MSNNIVSGDVVAIGAGNPVVATGGSRETLGGDGPQDFDMNVGSVSLRVW